jgi:hypothetical protein
VRQNLDAAKPLRLQGVTVTKRTVVLRARLTPAEARSIQAMAKRAGMTSGAFVRRMAEVYAKIEDEANAAADRAALETLSQDRAA